MKYRIILGGNLSYSLNIFMLQKKIIVVDAKPRNLHRDPFNRLVTLSFPWEYILSLINFTVKHPENFQAHSAVHSANRRNKYHLTRPTMHL
jgi:hypothetical protein